MGRERFPGAQFHIEAGPKATSTVKAVELDLGFSQLMILFISKTKGEKSLPPPFLKVVVGIK